MIFSDKMCSIHIILLFIVYSILTARIFVLLFYLTCFSFTSYIYTLKKVREHLLYYEAKLWTNISLQYFSVLNSQHPFYLKLLQSENDEYQAITVAGSGHLGYRNLIFDFRTLLIILAINSFHEV